MPASIAGKSKEELEQLVLSLIKKSKQQDKKIEGAPCELAYASNASSLAMALMMSA